MKTKFGEEVEKLQTYKTPGTPGQGIVRPEKKEDENIDNEMRTRYRSGVGMLLYLVKHSRPDIANSVRELSKVMDNPTIYSMKELNTSMYIIIL